MSFHVAADAYDRFMGRYSVPLSREVADALELEPGQRVLDVGCGPGALTAELVRRLGAGSVCAVDPSEPFVAAAQERFPGVDIRLATAESLPYEDDAFDVTVAQLVVHFMADPVGGLVEMARVTRRGGTVAASVWDFAGERAPLSVFWRAVNQLDAQARDESGLAGAREGHLAELFDSAGLAQVRSTVLTVRVPYATTDDWWQPYTLGVGPAGDYVASLDDGGRRTLKDRCAQLLPQAPFEITASAWMAFGRV